MVPAYSVASIILRMSSPPQVTMVMFSMTPLDLKQAVKTRSGLSKILFAASHERGDYRTDCTLFGLFLFVSTLAIHRAASRYCFPMYNDRPYLYWRDFEAISQDNSGMLRCIF